MSAPQPFGAVPSSRQLAWHRREQYGFVHFTVNTFTDREWGYGDESPSVFDPKLLDCDQWVAAAKAGGLTALILTAKHHDGFCLWPTETTSHNISASPFRGGRGDVVRELSEACRRGGIAFGVYCSPWDRNHPEYGRPGYVEVYHRQWEELLTGYGDLCEIWLDGANGGDGFYGGAREKRQIDAATYYQFDELFARMRELQPHAVIFSDVGPDIRWCGNESGYIGISAWDKVSGESTAFGNVDREEMISGKHDGKVWKPVEVDVSMRPGWFYHPTERSRSGDELFTIWLQSVGRGACLNLNMTPDVNGLIPDEDVLALMRLRHRVATLTAVDLAPRAELAASGGPDDGLESLVRESGVWSADTTTPSVTLSFAGSVRFQGIRVEEAIEYGQRIGAFSVDVEQWGGWHEIYRGGTVGARAIVGLDGAVGRRIRVRVTQSVAPPVLSSLRVYGAGRGLWAAQG